MSKRECMILIATMISLTLLVGCGGGPAPAPATAPTATPPPTATPVPTAEMRVTETPTPTKETPTETPPPAGPTTITWWTEPIAGSNREAFMRHVVEGFNAAHPNVVLEVNFIADLDRVTRTAVQGGEGPDIIQSPGPAFVVDYVDAGHVLPLDDYADKYGWHDTTYSWAIDVGRLKGQLYSLPLTYETMVLFYNATLFDEMDWDVPTSRAGLEALAQEAADAGILAFAHGNASWRAANEWYVTIFYNNYAGSQAVYEALSGQRRWDDPVFVEAIQLLKDYMDRGWFSGGREIYYTLQLFDIWGALGDGSAAMQMVGTWGFLHAPVYFEDTGNEWDWALLPPLRDGVQADYALGIGSSLAVNAACPDPDAAAEVLNWLFSDPQRVAQLISDIGGGEYVIPVRVNTDDFPTETDPRLIRAISAFSQAFESGQYGYTTWSFWPPATAQYIIEGMEQVWNGHITPQEFCAEQQRLFEEDMAKGNVPPIPLRP